MRKSLERSFRACVVFCGLLAFALSAAAQPSGQALARAHFERGYQLAQEGKLDEAIVEFETAYEKSPHFSVLYNLGQAHAAIGRSVDAVARLEEYLASGGGAISPQRRAEVEETLEFHRARIGSVLLEIEPADSRVFIDGRAVVTAHRGTPIPLEVGLHAVVVEHAGFAAGAANVRITSGAQSKLALQLEPLPPAELEVHCALPDVALRVDGQVARVPSPNASLRLAPGAHQLVLSRPGYAEQAQRIELRPGQRRALGCALTVEPNAKNLARLSVRHPRGTTVLVDGLPHSVRALPPGRHRVQVGGRGYEPEEKVVSLAAQQRLLLEVEPRRSSQWLLAHQQARLNTRRTVAYVVGGAGVATLLVALGSYIANGEAHEDWRADNARLVGRLHTDPTSVSPAELDALLADENRIRNRDAVAIGVGVLGLTSVLAASALLLWPESSSVQRTTTGAANRFGLAF